MCPDAPVPILIAESSIENGGMSTNVKNNILKLGADCALLTNNNWEKITKTRYVHRESNHLFFRLDSEGPCDRINLRDLELKDYDAVIISDYNKGFLETSDIDYICRQHPLVFIDTKKILGEWANEANFIKINNTEYNNSLPHLTQHLKDKIIHTMGSEGARYRQKVYPVTPSEVKDSSGAGDTFIAGLVTNYLKTRDIDLAIIFANECASEVVKHRGVVTI